MQKKHAAFGLVLSAIAHAAAAEDAAQANNPLANMTAFNLQNYYIGDLSGFEDSANQFWVRYAQPFSLGKTDWIFRGSLPINSFPTTPSGSQKTGIGDLNMFAAYLIDVGNPDVSFGIGPQITAPTASKKELGSEKWSAGLVNVLFDASSHRFQYGYLLTWEASFAGSSNRSRVNVGAFQPFAFYQLGGGTYLRSTPIWSYNFQNDAYSIPVGLGIGQVVRRGHTVFNFFLEPQVSVASRGPGQPEWQVFFGMNMQFTK